MWSIDIEMIKAAVVKYIVVMHDWLVVYSIVLCCIAAMLLLLCLLYFYRLNESFFKFITLTHDCRIV